MDTEQITLTPYRAEQIPCTEPACGVSHSASVLGPSGSVVELWSLLTFNEAGQIAAAMNAAFAAGRSGGAHDALVAALEDALGILESCVVAGPGCDDERHLRECIQSTRATLVEVGKV